ncbi:LytTR family transcriptional regulator DNA-binding domain-containing protein [Acanthopleuribacter pedis]|uniref:Response regulator transcription factor n=1 Tax=Acanthopleuribacter pedis TaxID=442870 RepID=A0A8J7Q2K3_9BACT|nr:response regulator transcription factor [Acanthopleuribacter pedis]
MRILIVEDVVLVAERIAYLVKQTFPEPIARLDVALTYDQAAQSLAERPYDLVFLDLNLHGREGFGLIDPAASYRTVVITAHDGEAARAFDLGVFDFIRKPITEQRFALAVTRFLRAAQSPNRAVAYLAVKSRGRVDMVAVTDIDYIKAAKNHAEIVRRSGGSLLHEYNIQRVQALLPDDFLRVHRSYLVARGAITRLVNRGGGRYQAVLVSGSTIPVNRVSYRALQQRPANEDGP